LPTDAASPRVVKCSLVIASHLDRGRLPAPRGEANLSSAIRVFVLEAASDARPDQ
jgi:hypothetical protein